MNTNVYRLIRDILSSVWMIQDPHRMAAVAFKILSDNNPTGEVLEKPKMAAGSSINVISLHGTMIKYETCESYGTVDIAAQIKQLADNDKNCAIILDIDSGGGAVNAVFPLTEAIDYYKSKGKPIFAHVDTCASAAYWVATHCDAIYLDNTLSSVGSIGAACFLMKKSDEEIAVYAKESPDKNLSYRQALEGKYELLQDELSPYVKEFHSDILIQRPGIKKDEPGVLTGKMFHSEEAVSLGLADSIKTLSQTIEVVQSMFDFS